jgi:two-component system, sensor histidine kinase PdtaS
MRFINVIFLLGLLCANLKAQTDLFTKAKSFEQIDSSIKYSKQYFEQCIEQADTTAIIDAGVYLSKKYFFKSDFKNAESIIHMVMPMAVFKKQLAKQANLYQVLASCYSYGGDLKKGLKMELVVLQLYEKLDNTPGVLSCMANIGETYRKIRNFNESKKILQKALAFCKLKNVTDPPVVINLNNRLAAVMSETGVLDSAIYYTKEAISVCKKSNNKLSEATSLNELGFIFKNSSKPDSALKYYRLAESIYTQMGLVDEVLFTINNIAMVYTSYNYPKELIIDTYLKLIETSDKNKANFQLDEAYSTLSKEYQTKGQHDKALEYFKKYHELRTITLKNVYDAGIIEIKEKYENEKIKEEISSVSTKLSTSEQLLNQKGKENTIIYVFLFVLVLSVSIITYLFFQNRKANQLLKQKNLEKDALIQEIHHRVKNNLQFVSSLINMQITSNKITGEVYSLNDTSRRIRAMALVHEMLYNQNDLKGIHIKAYIEELIDSINDLVNNNNLPLTFNIDVDDFVFDAEKSIALGMITSELVANAIKYAFKNNPKPQIFIKLKQISKNGFLEFIVKDNGVGMVEQNKDESKLGMRLINIFSRQLKGDYQFKNDLGLMYTITFNK